MSNFVRQLDWLTARFSIYFEVSPIKNARVVVYQFDKFGDPITNTATVYEHETLEKAIKKAYDRELQKLAKP